MSEKIKLNLGCGNNLKKGYVNVDKYGEPDINFDLETFPWPWDDSTVTEVVLNHVLEHLGQDTNTYLKIIKELYRICIDQAIIHIAVPHPRHDSYIDDPTHVRKITPTSLSLFSKENNKKCIKYGAANSTLGIYLDVDLEVTKVILKPDEEWLQSNNGKISTLEEFVTESRKYNNVIEEYRMEVKVIK